MYWVWVVLGTIIQLALSCVLFVLPISILIIDGGVSSLQETLINYFMFILPASCLISAGIVIYKYHDKGSRYCYLWYFLPIFLTFIFLVFFMA